ncbi:MAG: hypothetical protein K8W52_18560 [Deltaproteobacteria bacterium]|nr:hypothetical protein [Deltaproteobacteria bacterium]
MAISRLLLISVLGLTLASACGSDDALDSDEAARRLYLGLDGSIEDSLNLGFDGYNAASSANIDPQTAPGLDTGTLTITGQVDKGNSTNKEMRLHVGMVEFSDGVLTIPTADGNDTLTIDLTYDTSTTQADQPYLHLSLRNVPTGDFTGELTGLYHVSGDLAGDVTLNLTMAGTLADGGNGTVIRAVGSTTITGTATSGDGVYTVNLTR